MSRSGHLVIQLGLALLAIAWSSGPVVAAQTVHVNLLETSSGRMKIVSSVQRVRAGKVVFVVSNRSKDLEHEFLVARVNVAPDKVPIDAGKGVVKEAALKDLNELGDLKPGTSGTMTLDLSPGRYLLFCNLPGHYQAGMRRLLTVTK